MFEFVLNRMFHQIFVVLSRIFKRLKVIVTISCPFYSLLVSVPERVFSEKQFSSNSTKNTTQIFQQQKRKEETTLNFSFKK